MNLSPSIEQLHERLRELARSSAGDDGVALIDQMGPAVEPALTLVLLETMSSAFREMPGDVKIASVNFATEGVELEIAPGPFGHSDSGAVTSSTVHGWAEGETVRTTLRLPSGLRDAIVAQAEYDGQSANTWMLRTLAQGITHRTNPWPHGLDGQSVSANAQQSENANTDFTDKEQAEPDASRE